MTRFLAHAIAHAGALAGTSGLRGQPVVWLGGGDLGIWATAWSAEPVLTRDDAFAHHDLVGIVCDAGPCLPVRFGTWLANEAAARRSIEGEHDRFASALDRLADRQEVAITLLWSDGLSRAGRGHAVAPSGRAFLERRRAAHEATADRRTTAATLAARLGTELAVEQADVRHETCPSDEVALSMSLLARRGEADALKARATAAIAALADVRGVVSGPWPPYSFTEDLGSAGGS